MYWWNIRGLKAILTQGPLPGPVALRYAIANAVILVLMSLPSDALVNSWYLLTIVNGVACAVLGTYYCYRVNGGANGAHFLDRYFSLGFVVMIRLTPLLVAVAASLVFMSLLLTAQLPRRASEEGMTPWHAVLGVGFPVLFYWRLAAHIRSVAARDPMEHSS
jgi:hypothetical protein